MVAKYNSYENETIQCKPLIETNALSDNISLIFIENFYAWLLIMRSQGEAKRETKKLNGSQEAKGLWSLTNIRTKTRPPDVKPLVEANKL